jgi:hypothetical protein
MVPLLAVAVLVLSAACVLAVDRPQQWSRRNTAIEIETNDDMDDLMRTVLHSRVQQFDVEYGHRQYQDCQPCNGSSEMQEEVSRRLRLIPNLVKKAKKLVQKAKKTVRVAPAPASSPIYAPIPNYVTNLLDPVVFANETSPSRNITIGGIFDGIQELISTNPILLPIGIVVAIAVAIPLIILESISLSTGTPILCILGAETSNFGDCRRRRLADSSFFDEYMSNKAVQSVLDTRSSKVTKGDATAEVLSLLNVSPQTRIFLGNTTIGGIFDSITNFAGNRPIAFGAAVATSLVIILPFIVLESISLSTGTPILCILGAQSSVGFGDCRRGRRRRVQDNSENEQEWGTDITDESSSCQREYLACEMNNALVSLGQQP